MQRNGWILLFHECIVQQLQKLHTAGAPARRILGRGRVNHPWQSLGMVTALLWRFCAISLDKVCWIDPHSACPHLDVLTIHAKLGCQLTKRHA
jgi:hypothetical protein